MARNECPVRLARSHWPGACAIHAGAAATQMRRTWSPARSARAARGKNLDSAPGPARRPCGRSGSAERMKPTCPALACDRPTAMFREARPSAAPRRTSRAAPQDQASGQIGYLPNRQPANPRMERTRLKHTCRDGVRSTATFSAIHFSISSLTAGPFGSSMPSLTRADWNVFCTAWPSTSGLMRQTDHKMVHCGRDRLRLFL